MESTANGFEFSNLSLDVLEWDVNKVWQVLAGYPCYPVEIGGIGRGGKWTFIAREKPTSKHQQLNPFGQNMLLLGAHIQHSSHGGFFLSKWPTTGHRQSVITLAKTNWILQLKVIKVTKTSNMGDFTIPVYRYTKTIFVVVEQFVPCMDIVYIRHP